MRQKEQRLWDTMRRNAPRGLWIQRVENLVMAGMPDLYVEGVWVELKAPTRPKRDTTPLLGREGLNPDQVNWHLQAARKNVRSYVLIRDDLGHLYLLRGVHAAELNGWPRSRVVLDSLADDWPGVFTEIS
jgi:hypothetical protein